MAGELLNFDPNLGPPPQAPTPVETAADVVPVQVQSPQDMLRASAFGDKGAEQYAALVNAGQPRPTMPPVAGGAGLTGLVGSRAPVSPVSNANVTDPIANALMALGGQDPAKMQLQQQQLAASQQGMRIQQERELRENASEFYSTLMPSVFKSFAGRPDLATTFLMRAAQSRGLTVDPAVLVSLNQQMLDGTLPIGTMNRIIMDQNTPAGVIVRMGASAKMANEAISAVAASDKAAAEARIAPTKAALGLFNEAEKLSNPPSPTQIQAAGAAGQVYQEQTVPGIPGAKMWVRVPKGGGAAGTIDPEAMPSTNRNLREQQFLKAAKERLGPNAKDVDVMQEVERMRASADAQRTEAVKSSGLAAEGRTQVARGIGLVNQLEMAVNKLGLAKDAKGAMWQPLDFVKRMATRDPVYNVINAFPATLSNVARALGEKGVLTDADVARIDAATGVGWFDTQDTYQARINFVKEAMRRGQAEVETAIRESRATQPVYLGDVTYDGDPLGTQGALPAGEGTPLSEATGGGPSAAPAAPSVDAILKQYGY